ncbi:MAG: hypothetical protein GTO18_04765 [Anaerolineales bacterium]|nr:hypothetical protein [Anaerolineales bacterium]
MNERGQLLVVVAFVISAAMLLLAVAVDGGRLFIRRNQMKRAAQSAADAGVSVAAERMVELAEERRGGSVEGTSVGSGDEKGGSCQPEPQCWLSEEDWDTLSSSQVRALVEAEALDFAGRNGFSMGSTGALAINVDYSVQPMEQILQVGVTIRSRTTILLVGLLSQDFVDLEVHGFSVIKP